MSSFGDRPRSLFSPMPGVGPFTPPPDLSPSEETPTTPLPATTSPLVSHLEQIETVTLQAQRSPFPAAVTLQLPLQSGAGTTRVLTRTLSGDPETAGPREPVVIKGEMKKKSALVPISHASHTKRRRVVSLASVGILFLITAITLLMVSPIGHEIGLNLGPLQAGSSLITGSNSNTNLVAQATATAIYNQQIDGYDPYANGGQTISNGAGSLNWPTGQCTFWANYRYHQLTGFWVAWNGNADQWVAGAQAAGWNVSRTPHVPSIIVLMPYVQGAYGYGHVAVVESIVPNSNPTAVHTSNMNWWAGGGGWNRVSYYNFTVGSGVYFIWHK